MPIILQKDKLQLGLYGRYFNTYFSDNMSNLTTVGTEAPQVRSSWNSYSVGNTDTWLFRGYFLADTTASNWRFRTTSDDASYVWIGTNSTAIDTSLNTSNAVVNNGGLHGTQTRTSSDISLTSGILYPFAVVIGNNSGPGVLTLEFSSNGGSSYDDNGEGYFFHNPYAANGYNLDS